MGHVSVDLRRRILALAENVQSSREIATLLNDGKSTVNDLRKKPKSGLTINDCPRFGRRRKSTKGKDLTVARKSIQNVLKTKIANIGRL